MLCYRSSSISLSCRDKSIRVPGKVPDESWILCSQFLLVSWYRTAGKPAKSRSRGHVLTKASWWSATISGLWEGSQWHPRRRHSRNYWYYNCVRLHACSGANACAGCYIEDFWRRWLGNGRCHVGLNLAPSVDTGLTLFSACSVSAFALFVAEVKLGVGEHLSNPQLLGNVNSIVRYLWFHTWIMVLGISFVKISVGFFLLRLVQGKLYKVCPQSWQSLRRLTL